MRLSGTDVTFWIHVKVTVTLNGRPCKLSDLVVGDTVTVIGDPVNRIIAVRR